jgi:hypothetical protein
MRKPFSLLVVLASGAASTIGAHALAGTPPAAAPSVVAPKAPVSPAKGTVAPPGLAWSGFNNAAFEVSSTAVRNWIQDAEVSIGQCNNNNLVIGAGALHNNSSAFPLTIREGLIAAGARPVVAQGVTWALTVAFTGWAQGFSANVPNVFPELTSTTAKECHAPLASHQSTPFRVRLGSSTGDAPGAWTGAWIRGEIIRQIGPAIAAEPGADAAITAFANQFEGHFTRWRDAASISNLTCTATGLPPGSVKPTPVKEGAPSCVGQVRGANVLTGPTF